MSTTLSKLVSQVKFPLWSQLSGSYKGKSGPVKRYQLKNQYYLICRFRNRPYVSTYQKYIHHKDPNSHKSWTRNISYDQLDYLHQVSWSRNGNQQFGYILFGMISDPQHHGSTHQQCFLKKKKEEEIEFHFNLGSNIFLSFAFT